MRLDLALVERGLVRSRNQAAELIDQGRVSLNGVVVNKPSHKVLPQDLLEVIGEIYVARSAEKLNHALGGFRITVPEVCLDIGASTGGFTQVLLARGAKKVIALDVGTDQLSPEIRQDPRVVEMSGVNVRDVRSEEIKDVEKVRLTVVDLSFISLSLVAKKLAELTPSADFVILIKPQFELQKSKLNRQGVVISSEDRLDAVRSALSALGAAGMRVAGVIGSPIKGSSGNTEYLAHVRHGEAANIEELVAGLV